ncbi:metallophosphoesterase family protein [Parapedobacter deserti]|uniref:Metallophosphoesterase family protein n=1 Tax=Parapedobacter deserti TaxID=1912957 RepID=A0ABV7JL79_9SPHI
MRNTRQTGPVFLKNILDDSYLFKPLPCPTGMAPYRLPISNVIGDAAWFLNERMRFHMIGDTGSLRHSVFQPLVASALAQQAKAGYPAGERPAFLYHLGDVVYNHGEASEYHKQFLGPYEDYPAPIFAIAGNHDGDINPNSELVYQSLDAFMDVFCDTYQRRIPFGNGSKRLSMVQPHVYWTLETPLARFIGLYGNVTKHGVIDAEQREWFIEELRYADTWRPGQAVIVCVHHAPYSADTNHGSSPAIITFLEHAFETAGVKPDIVFSGHVHNYQRFSKAYEDGTVVPYVVAGAGGYADLHPVASVGDSEVDNINAAHQVHLDNFCDDRYGFLSIAIEKKAEGLELVGEYYTLAQDVLRRPQTEPALFDRFVVPLRRPAEALENTDCLGQQWQHG